MPAAVALAAQRRLAHALVAVPARAVAVSYTHLTLPTSALVEISVVPVSLKKKKKYTQQTKKNRER